MIFMRRHSCKNINPWLVRRCLIPFLLLHGFKDVVNGPSSVLRDGLVAALIHYYIIYERILYDVEKNII
jgi:hypothetical protein